MRGIYYQFPLRKIEALMKKTASIMKREKFILIPKDMGGMSDSVSIMMKLAFGNMTIRMMK